MSSFMRASKSKSWISGLFNVYSLHHMFACILYLEGLLFQSIWDLEAGTAILFQSNCHLSIYDGRYSCYTFVSGRTVVLSHLEYRIYHRIPRWQNAMHHPSEEEMHHVIEMQHKRRHLSWLVCVYNSN